MSDGDARDHDVRVTFDGSVVIVLAPSEVDLGNVDTIERALFDSLTPAVRGVVFDLSTTHYIDSSGVRLLYGIVRTLDARGIPLHGVQPEAETPRRVLDVVGVRNYVAFHPDASAARAAFAPFSRSPHA